MRFCGAADSKDDVLDRVFASLSLSQSEGAELESNEVSASISNTSRNGMTPHTDSTTPRELSTLLLSMRKLREALLASSRIDTFSQRAYIFTIRSAILCSSYESYAVALQHLLLRIHPQMALPSSELHEFVGYYILDQACRLGDLGRVYKVRKTYGYRDETVRGVLKALVHDDWVTFRRLKGCVDGYQRRLMEWAEDRMRRHALKCLGRSYLSVDREYVERCAGREWELLKEKDGVGWVLEEGGDRVTIRSVKNR